MNMEWIRAIFYAQTMCKRPRSPGQRGFQRGPFSQLLALHTFYIAIAKEPVHSLFNLINLETPKE